MSELGRWWAAVPREDWPEAHHASILEDFDTAGEGGDRRQEIVFIGTGLGGAADDAAENRATIIAALDACLLTDDEMRHYRRVQGDAGECAAAFPGMVPRPAL